MGDDGLALELWLDRREAALTPELRAHDRAVLAAVLAERPPPPPPPLLLDPAWARLPARAARTGDARLARRAATLARWSLAARVATDPAVRAAARGDRDLDGLGRRHAALAVVAGRLGLADAGALIAALYGAAPVEPGAPVDPDPRVAGERVEPGPLAPSAPVPTPRAVLATLASITAIDPAPIALHHAARALTIVVAPGEEVHCLIGAGDDPPAALTVAVHELGHGLLASARRGLPPSLAAPVSRVVDEAAAAWAVRALEDPAVIADAGLRATLARRRARREHLTRALARFEAACLAGVAPAIAWAAVAAIDPRPPSTHAALFDEPGVMAAYVAADRAAPACPPRA